MAKLTLLLLFAFCTQAIRAQIPTVEQLNDSTSESIAWMETTVLKDSINLTSQQVVEVQSINRAYYQKIAALKKTVYLQEEIAAKRDQYAVDRANQIQSKLSIEQFERYIAFIDRRERRMKSRLYVNN